MLKKIMILLALVLPASPSVAQKDRIPNSPDNWHTSADRNPCMGEGDTCFAWQGKLEHCQSASVSFLYSEYDKSISQFSISLVNIEVMKANEPGTVRKIARLEPRAPGYLREHEGTVAIWLDPGCELELTGMPFIGYPYGKLTCSITFDNEDPSWTVEIGSTDILFQRVSELPQLTK